jgi:pyrroloquinoline quinone biosynthesis protein D
VIDGSFVPALAAKVRVRRDRLTGGWLLLSPERGHLLNESAAAIVALCDGQRTIREIAAELARDYAPPTPGIENDTIELVAALGEHGLLA